MVDIINKENEDFDGKFYLGRIVDPEDGKTGAQPLLYDPDDLTTHAVVVGMTGSGKTGLCIDLLEEAALNGVPALMIDPKGDITNSLLHFPDLLPQDFQPWINPDEARRSGQSPEEAAREVAERWRKGLSEWNIKPERLRALKNSAHFAVFTPGSDAGIPVSILASLKAPEIPWQGNQEILREKISSTVTALLGLVGLQNVDPVRSREHILLANIFEQAWSQGKDLELEELILQTQTPPFIKLGVFDVNTFFPEKERFDLAMLLNNILAAPTFQTWIQGQPLEIPSLLYGSDGRPRHSVFYIAHLNDAERMFFVTLLYSAIETWMRAQAGTAALRAIIYFDEIYGYLPPVGNPPSKSPMLRMLKQARAFGVGQVLATQNPVDVDYKALSNAGTWFIGKLQTDQDKQRLLDGLEGATGGRLDRGTYDRLISGLGKRVFLLHNIHKAQPLLFQTRWAMNYLVGPLTRAQLPALNLLATPGTAPEAPMPSSAAAATIPGMPTMPLISQPGAKQAVAPATDATNLMGTETRPSTPSRVAEFFLPNNLSYNHAFKKAGIPYPQDAQPLGILYRPALLAQASVRFTNHKYNLNYLLTRTAIVEALDPRALLNWEDFLSDPVDPHQLDTKPALQARFAPLETPLTDAKALSGIQKDFLDWVYNSSQVTVRANETLKTYAGPEVSHAEFRRTCADQARRERDAEARKVSDSYDRKVDRLKQKLNREERELDEDQTELSQRRMEEIGTHAENLFSLFGGRRRRLSTSLTKRRLTQQAKADVEESLDSIEEFKEDVADLEKEKAQALEEVNERWSEIANQMVEISVTPYKKDTLLDLFGVAWVPYYLVKTEGEVLELPGYGNL